MNSEWDIPKRRAALLDRLLASPRALRLGLIQLGVLAAAALAVAVNRYGALVLALFGVPLAALLLFNHSTLGLYTILLTLPVEDLIPGVGTATGTRLLGMVVFGVWFVRKIMLRESWQPLINDLLLQVSAVFLLWILVSSLWASERSMAWVGLFSMLQLILFCVMVIDVVRSWSQAAWIARLLVISGSIAAFVTVQQYFVDGVRRAGDGVAGGINFTASSLVSILPFAFYLLRSRTPGFWKFASLLYIALAVVAVAVTFSRTSYILLVLILLIHFWELSRARSGWPWLLLIVLLTGGVLLTLPRDEINERAQTIAPLLADWRDAFSGVDSQADVRAYHWRVGGEMLRDSPLVGVGYNNYGLLFLTYQFEVDGSPAVFRNPRSPHNSYIGILSELGIVGGLLFLGVLGVTLRNLARAWLHARKAEARDEQFFIRALIYFFLAQLIYGMALNIHLNKNFWMLLGLSSVVYYLSQSLAGVPIRPGERSI